MSSTTQGYLLFLRETTLMAQPFDARRLALTGDAFPIAEQIQTKCIDAAVRILSLRQRMGCWRIKRERKRPTLSSLWFDRTGKQIGVLGDPAAYSALELSPDGSGLPSAFQMKRARGRTSGFTTWRAACERASRSARQTFLTSIWSPDGSRIVFNSRRKGISTCIRRPPAEPAAEEVLLEDNLDKYPDKLVSGRPVYSLRKPRFFKKPAICLSCRFPEIESRFRFCKRSSTRTTMAEFLPTAGGSPTVQTSLVDSEIYVAPFPGPGGKWQISTAGGTLPRWRHDGTEIFYLTPDNRLMAAAVNGKGASFEVGAVKPLFATRIATGGSYQYDVSADGQRFLINTAPEQATSAPITVVLNWTAGLKK